MTFPNTELKTASRFACSAARRPGNRRWTTCSATDFQLMRCSRRQPPRRRPAVRARDLLRTIARRDRRAGVEAGVLHRRIAQVGHHLAATAARRAQGNRLQGRRPDGQSSGPTADGKPAQAESAARPEERHRVCRAAARAALHAHDLAYLFGAAVLLFLAKVDAGASVVAIGEKTPDNVRYFDVLLAIFPRAKFIHLVRDGRDCAISGWFHARRIRPDWDTWQFARLESYVDMFAREWAIDLAEGSAFAAAHPEACLTVRYEDSGGRSRADAARLLDFLGAASDVASLAGSRRRGLPASRGSGAAGRRQENRDSFFRNGIPGDWRRLRRRSCRIVPACRGTVAGALRLCLRVPTRDHKRRHPGVLKTFCPMSARIGGGLMMGRRNCRGRRAAEILP